MIITIENNQVYPNMLLYFEFYGYNSLIGKILSNFLSIVNLSASYEQLIFLKEKSLNTKRSLAKLNLII